MSLIGKAAARGDIDFRLHDLRRWTTDVHHTVDDTPFGGGPGMVMKADVWGVALDEVLAGAAAPPARAPDATLPTDAGSPRTVAAGQPRQGDGGSRRRESGLLVSSFPPQAERRSPRNWPPRTPGACLVFACGRYEGIDSRVVADARTRMPVDEVSIGDYVLAGGEVAVCVILEAVCRLLPGVLGNEQSAADDSFGEDGTSGLLEGPVYTRPRTWRGREVPDVLLSGNHKAIARWRRDEALRRTAAVRPDLVSGLRPDARDLEE